MKRKYKIALSIVIAIYFVSIFVEAMLADDKIISSNICAALVCIESVLLIVYIFYFLHNYRVVRKKAKNSEMREHNATMSSTLKHVSGLPLAKGLSVEMYYGPKQITFKKDGQNIVISREKITGIDIIMGDNSARKALSGAASGKYVVGGNTGAAIGALSAIKTYLIISYSSDGKNKSITLDTVSSGSFASKVVKDFQKSASLQISTIEL